jgi:hypothetical protein
MDRQKPPPPLSSESIDLTCTDSEDAEKKESSLIPAIDLTSMLNNTRSDVDGGDVSKEENEKIQRSYGSFPLVPVFFKHVVEVCNSPEFFKY